MPPTAAIAMWSASSAARLGSTPPARSFVDQLFGRVADIQHRVVLEEESPLLRRRGIPRRGLQEHQLRHEQVEAVGMASEPLPRHTLTRLGDDSTNPTCGRVTDHARLEIDASSSHGSPSRTSMPMD